MPDTDKMVDLGTIDDMDGIPAPVERDYEHLIVFGRRLDRGMWTWLRQRIDEGERQVDAYEAAVEKCNACTFPASCSEFGRCVLEAPVAAPLSFDVTAYRGGVMVEGTRLSLAVALRYLLDHLPAEACKVGFEGDPDTSEVAVIRIDWSKVPPDIRQGAAE